jgi:hypothetical protein
MVGEDHGFLLRAEIPDKGGRRGRRKRGGRRPSLIESVHNIFKNHVFSSLTFRSFLIIV